MRHLHVAAAALLLPCLWAADAGASLLVKAAVDRNKITIGDRIAYTVRLEYDPATEVRFPPVAGALGEFEIKDYKITGPSTRLRFRFPWFYRVRILEHRYIISAYTTGEFKLPEIPVEYTGKDGQSKQAKSGEIKIFVEGVKHTGKDIDDVRDVKPPLHISVGVLFYIILLLVLALAGGGYYANLYMEKRKQAAIFGEEDMLRPAHELAYERIAKLRELDLPGQGKTKEHYIVLSEIIRKYLEQRYSIPVLDRTTNELYRDLREVPGTDKKMCMQVKDFLLACDLVKFAKFVPEVSVIDTDTESAVKIVDSTKSLPKQPAAAQETEVKA